MAEYSFDEEEDLGKICAEKKLICRLLSVKSTQSPQEFTDKLRTCCGGWKFGFAFGFWIAPKAEELKSHPLIVVWVPKLASKFLRNYTHGCSSWYVWRLESKGVVKVVSAPLLKKMYGFDIDKFWKSDWFLNSLPKLKQASQQQIDTVIRPYLEEKMPFENLREALRFTKAIEDSFADVDDTDLFNAGDDGEKHVNRTNATYDLVHPNMRAKQKENT